ncbi:fimbrial protein [Enterobacter bugandensis]|nr:fimbrial protein [Enterobacter bugandensis]
MAFKKYALAAAVMAVMSGSAMAAQDLNTGHIQFNGMVNPNTCDINLMANSVTQNQEDFTVALTTVDIQDVMAGTVGDVASTLGETPFTISVNCPVTVTGGTGVSVQFDTYNGTTTQANGLLYPQTNIKNAAKDVALVLKNSDNSQVKIGQVNNSKVATFDTNNHAQLDYKIAYTKTSTTPTSGPVTAYTTYTIKYE